MDANGTEGYSVQRNNQLAPLMKQSNDSSVHYPKHEPGPLPKWLWAIFGIGALAIAVLVVMVKR